jgi:hypothetical protein
MSADGPALFAIDIEWLTESFPGRDKCQGMT